MFNDNVEERYGLAIERIKEIAAEPGLKTDGFADYFKCIATFILKMDKLAADLKADVFRELVFIKKFHSFTCPFY